MAVEFERRRVVKTTLNLIPLINVVFLLLIFFMLSSTMVVPENLGIDLPRSKNASPRAPSSIVVVVNRDGRMAIDGRTVAVADLGAVLARAVADSRDAEVLIKADMAAAAVHVTEIISQAQAAGISRVGLATEGPKNL